MADFDNVEMKYNLDACATCPHIDIFHVYDKKTNTRGKCIHTDCLQAATNGEGCEGYISAHDFAEALRRADKPYDFDAEMLHTQQLEQHGVPRAMEG